MEATSDKNIQCKVNLSVLKPKGFEKIIGSSMDMAIILERAEIAAKGNYSVLITGENGVGKKFLARTIAETGRLKGKRWNILKCIAVDNQNFLWQLSTTICNGGILILDGVNRCNLKRQFDILGKLDSDYATNAATLKKSEDFQLISTSIRNLQEMARNDEFLPELYPLLADITIEISPLRYRPNDILLLAHHFVEEFNREQRKKDQYFSFKLLSENAKKALKGHSWPGNVRELRHVIKQAFIFSPGNLIEAEHLSIISDYPSAVNYQRKVLEPGFDMNKEINRLQREYIKLALKETKGKKADAAKSLGLNSYQALDSRMKAIGMLK